MSEQIRLQQALFGYREGHNLVASSIPFPPRVRHFLATVTDISGPEAAEGFESTHTGLPLAETDYYAFFCTWPAPEMSRPGCVWSHVILVDLTDLARIPDLATLQALLRRPAPDNLSAYEDTLTVLLPDAPSRRRNDNFDRERALRIIQALYDEPQKSVVILDDNNRCWEETILAIWSQQWPKLRRNFAFSTGSLGDRRLAGINFDLQIAPSRSERLWRRSHLPSLIIQVSSDAPPLSFNQWTDDALVDLLATRQTPLRNFMFSFGSDVENPRYAFKGFVTTFRVLETPKVGWTKVLTTIAEYFPGESDALRLKEYVLPQGQVFNFEPWIERSWEIASFLFFDPKATAYAKMRFDHAESANSLWKHDREKVLSMLARVHCEPANPAAHTFVNAVINLIEIDELEPIFNSRPGLIPLFIKHRPSIAFSPRTWIMPYRIQEQILVALDAEPLSEKDWGDTVAAMFISATSVAVQHAVKRAGPHAIEGALHWLEEEIAQKLLPSQGWREALAPYAAERLTRTEELTPAALALCAWFVPPETARRMLSVSRHEMRQLADTPLENLPAPLRLPTAFLLVSCGLRAIGLDGVRFITRGFFEVHKSMENPPSFAEESWQLIAPELPDLGWWREWDKCKRLRRAVGRWFSKNVKSGNPLLKVATTPDRRKLARQVFEAPEEDDGPPFLD
jgi:hypothetical protein